MQQCADSAMGFQGMSQRNIGIDAVDVAPAIAVSLHDARLLEFGDDPLDPTLGQANLGGDVTQRLFPPCGKAHQDVSVVAEESPAAWLLCLSHFIASLDKRPD